MEFEQAMNLKIPVADTRTMQNLVGEFDRNLKLIQEMMGVIITVRNSEITVTGEPGPVLKVQSLFAELIALLEEEPNLTEQQVRYAVEMVQAGAPVHLKDLQDEVICISSHGRPIKPKTFGQKRYVEAIRKNPIVFGIGPAGTGKTYLAVACAVAEMRAKRVNKIVLTRPAVEAGERLGFLPGDLQQKVDPYLRPLYDALNDTMGAEVFNALREKGAIEVIPLAYMRGRTLDDAFIILDEAQNTTPEQMKMFLTRMGFRSHVVVTGDITQVDLPDGKKSGLKTVQRILNNIPGIEFMKLSDKDVVRHSLVQKIIKAYEAYEKGADNK